jgi:hypothetical protein
MADKSEVASRLDKFFEAVQTKTNKRPVRSADDYQQYTRPETGPDPILKIYEEYLSKLTDEERAEFDRIVKKMSGAV